MTMNDPIERFRVDLAQATQTESFDAHRFVLATVGSDGSPTVRYLLLKGVDRSGFTFYTNLASRKARELDTDPRAALCFHWHTTGVQVRIEGRASRVSTEEARAYFHSRPRGSQIGAWASRQSAPVSGEAELQSAFAEVEDRFRDQDIPLPDFWGGYRVEPMKIEFWKDQPNRMHLRDAYSRSEDGWTIEQLWP